MRGIFCQRFPGLLCMSRRSIVSSHSFRKIALTHNVHTFREDLPIELWSLWCIPLCNGVENTWKTSRTNFYFTYAN